MNKVDLISKYEHRLTLKNYSNNTLRSYLNGLHIFLDYLHTHRIKVVAPELLEEFFITAKKNWNTAIL